MSCTITNELSVMGNLLVLTKKEGTRTVATDKMLLSGAIIYIYYPNELLRIDSLNEMHNKTHWTLAGGTTYAGMTEFASEGDTTAVTLPCGTSYTPSQAFADLILFAQTTINGGAVRGTVATASDWQVDSTVIGYDMVGNIVTLTVEGVETAEAAPSTTIATLPTSLRPDSVRMFTAWESNAGAAVGLTINTDGTMVLSAAAQNNVINVSGSYQIVAGI